jgi:hypothetical protein
MDDVAGATRAVGATNAAAETVSAGAGAAAAL